MNMDKATALYKLRLPEWGYQPNRHATCTICDWYPAHFRFAEKIAFAFAIYAKQKKQDTFYEQNMWHGILAGNIIQVSKILLCQAIFCVIRQHYEIGPRL